MRRTAELINDIVGTHRMAKMRPLRKTVKTSMLHLHPERHLGNPTVRMKQRVNVNVIMSVKNIF